MQLILLQKVVNLGNLGDKVTVKPGYGRNFLVPQAGRAGHRRQPGRVRGQARRLRSQGPGRADAANGRQAKAGRRQRDHLANASTEGKLYGSVGPREIADAITRQLGVEGQVGSGDGRRPDPPHRRDRGHRTCTPTSSPPSRWSRSSCRTPRKPLSPSSHWLKRAPRGRRFLCRRAIRPCRSR